MGDCISRQAVLDTLDTSDRFMDEERTVENYKVLLKECYEVLPSVTPKVSECEDAISRQAVLAGLASIAKAKAKSDAQKSLMGRVMFFTEHLPSITPKQKVGRWIFDDKCKEHGHCSLCGYGSVDLMDGEPHDFCRRCGAKMVESEVSE